MPRFHYRAVNASGEVVHGDMDASDRKALVQALRKQGYWLLHTEAARGAAGRGTARRGGRRRRRGRMDADALALFTRELATLVGAGLPLDRALSTIAEQSQSEAPAATASRLLQRVRGGASLADALAEQPEVFPNYYIGLVRAGEAGGSLHEVLGNLTDSLERARTLREDVRAALNYPILVLIAAGISIVILLVGVIPEFEPLFADAGAALPLTTRVVLAVSQAFRAYWWTLPVAAVLLLLAIRRAQRSEAVRARLDAGLLRLPLIGPLIKKIEAARFCRTLGTLLRNGVDVVPALDMSVETLSNARMAGALAEAAPRLRRGEGLAEPLSATGAFPALAIQLMQIGETSGQLDAMLLTAAGVYDEEVRRDTSKLISMLVPVVTLVLGVVVAALIGSILSAILSSYDLPV